MAPSDNADLVVDEAATQVDPFVSNVTGPPHHRYSTFDSQLFAIGPGMSTEQVKRALEAHLKETERRMEEAGKLGTSLVQQQKELTERLKDVEAVQSEGELSQELRQKLANIEKDYNEVARESARAFLPKQRVPSNEAAQGSSLQLEGRGGKRSVSPSKFESLATASPSKLSVPNRKLRNQPTNRIHDMEFMTEIGTSLVTQVRNLQALLAERDEELKELKVENSQLEVDMEAVQQRLKTLDESEHRYKDENWNLETQIHELMAAQKDAADREKKLTQNLSILQSEKNSTQRELDEVKENLSRQDEKHSAAIKGLEIDLGTSRRNAAIAETERMGLQKKVEDLTSQNQELAKAFSLQRGRAAEREPGLGVSDENFESAADHLTPEHSPPPSPIKGTPRHSMLESETLKTSLGHAQRTIQSLRTNVHREKTEKLEMRRMLQEARDELEKLRADPPAPTRKSRKMESREFKKPNFRLGQLGGARASKTEVEVYVEDPNWEDQGDVELSPRGSRGNGIRPSIEDSSTDQFDTANETSDAAFETANEHDRGTETEDFQTGAEELSDDDQATETEASPSRGTGRLKKRPSLPPLHGSSSRSFSYHSTASTSGDDDDFPGSDMRTPTTQSSAKMRFRSSRSTLNRRSRQVSEEPNFQSSPASFANSSMNGTPQAPAQSLFAELGELDGSDDDSYVGGRTPSRRSIRSVTPGSMARPASPPPEMPPLPRAVMVDSEMMTEPVDVRSLSDAPLDLAQLRHASLQNGASTMRPMSMQSVVGPGHWGALDEARDGHSSRPVSTISYSDAFSQHDPDMDAELARFPAPPTSSGLPGLGVTPVLLPPQQTLSVADIRVEDIEPLAEPKEEPTPTIPFSFSALTSEHIEPVSEPETPAPLPPSLSMPAILSEHVEPVVEPEPVQPAFSLSSVLCEMVEPVAEPEPVQPMLSLSSVLAEAVEPVAEPEPLPLVPPTLSHPVLLSQEVEPIAEKEVPIPPIPTFGLSNIVSEHIEPVAEPELPAPVLPDFSVSPLRFESVEPIPEPEPPALVMPSLTHSALVSQHIEPVAEEVVEARAILPLPPSLSMASILSEHVEPVAELEPTKPAPPTFTFSSLSATEIEPLADPIIPAAPLSVSPLMSEEVAPVLEPAAPVHPLSFSRVLEEHVEPIMEPQVPAAPLSLSTIVQEHVEPVAEPEIVKPALSVAAINAQHVEPVADPEPASPPPAVLGFSPIVSEHVEPLPDLDSSLSPMSLSSVEVLHDIEPIAPHKAASITPIFGLSPISSIESEPVEATSPKRHGFIIPRNASLEPDFEAAAPSTPSQQELEWGRLRSRGRKGPQEDTIIAEDATRHSPGGSSPVFETPESQRPLKELSANTDARPLRKPSVATADQGAQTSLTAENIDQLLNAKSRAQATNGHARSDSLVGSIPTPSTVRINRPQLVSETSFDSSFRDKDEMGEKDIVGDLTPFRRPGSAASARSSIKDMPPLPANHREVIEAARTGSSSGGQGTMGPPMFPASALRAQRPWTPNNVKPPTSPLSVTHARLGTPSLRAPSVRQDSNSGMADVHSPTRLGFQSRKSSVSSFVSEIDTRFNMQGGMMFDAQGFGSNTDPRMIQAITQTMIGEYLWKYTRKPGRGDISEKRHRRYFWVHPYTRTLYWSDQDPSGASRVEHRAKSVPIEAVRVVTDDNPMPPGLHRKSLVVISPGRTIKFTCNTGQRHETWFNALSYLLLRTNEDGQNDTEEMVGNITSADVDEFNPQFNHRPASGTRPAAPPSLSSYNSRTTRNESPALGMSMNYPTLTPTPKKTGAVRPSVGTLGRISGYWKDSKLGSLRSRSTSGREPSSIYQASEVHDSAEDLRQMIEQQDRDSDRLENVRACCDGKHDVGTLTHSHKRGRQHAHNHSHGHAGPSTTPTPSGTIKTRT